MIDNKLVQKMVKHTLNPERKKFVDNNIMHPEREWVLGILVGLLVCFLGGWWSVVSYGVYSNVSVQDKEDLVPVVYRAGMVDEVTKDFIERENVHNKILDKLKGQVPVATVSLSTSTEKNTTIEATSSIEIMTDSNIDAVSAGDYEVETSNNGDITSDANVDLEGENLPVIE